MLATKGRRSRRNRQAVHLGKPHGVIAPRVQAATPEHFGILAIDPAKARSYTMLADFYGRVLIPVTVVEHTQHGFQTAIAGLRQAVATHGLRDLVVAVEQTGAYHRPIQRAYAAAGFETRIVHPSISRHFREAGAYDNKTDPTDLEGIFRAAINGFGLQQPTWDPTYTALQLLARHRRDLVSKSTLLRCQILEHLEACLPGYAKCFDNVFITKIALIVPKRYATPAAVAEAGLEGLTQRARLARVQVHSRTLLKIVGWAQNAPAPDRDAALHQRLLGTLDDDRISKSKNIQSIERELVDHLVQTPYVRLLALAGINVVLAAEFAGEAGPMEYYADGPGHHRPCRPVSQALSERRGQPGLGPPGPPRQPPTPPGAAPGRGHPGPVQRPLPGADGQVVRPGEGPPRRPCAGGRAVRPDRLPDGGRHGRIRSSRLPGASLCYEQVDGIS